MGRSLKTDLIKFNRPCREFVEQASLLRRARDNRFREDVEQRWGQPLRHHLLQNRVHEQVQQLEVVQRSILKLASITHTNVDRDIERIHAEFAVGVLVIPTIVRYERREGRHGDVMMSEIED